jgi:hypothetical protein
MSDRHMRILRHIARHSQRELDIHDAVDHAGDTAAAEHRQHLGDAANRTRGQVTAAEQRREPAPHEPSPPNRKA